MIGLFTTPASAESKALYETAPQYSSDVIGSHSESLIPSNVATDILAQNRRW